QVPVVAATEPTETYRAQPEAVEEMLPPAAPPASPVYAPGASTTAARSQPLPPPKMEASDEIPSLDQYLPFLRSAAPAAEAPAPEPVDAPTPVTEPEPAPIVTQESTPVSAESTFEQVGSQPELPGTEPSDSPSTF